MNRKHFTDHSDFFKLPKTTIMIRQLREKFPLHHSLKNFSGKMFSILMVLLFSVGFAQGQNAVTGKITNERGEPLAGASVKIKNSASGTTTNEEGLFSINVNRKSTRLNSSHVKISY